MNILTKFSLKNALVIFLIIVLLLAGGIYSSTSIQQELMPNITIPFVTVVTIYPGAAPEDIADSISNPVQKAVSGIQGIKQVNATSNENISFVMVNFNYSKDMEKAEREIQDAVNKVKLPEKAQKPMVTRFSYGSIPVVGYSVSSSQDENELAKIIKDKVQPSLSGIKGVGSVSIDGIQNKNVYIKVDDKKLKENGLTLQDVQQTLTANDISFPVGTVDISGQTLPLKISRKVANLNDIKSIPLIVPPDTSKIMGDSMKSAMSGINEMLGKSQQEIGKAIGGNTQAIALLSVIQKSQALILTQSEVLNNPASSQEVKSKAQQDIMIATKTIEMSQKSLDEILKQSMASAKQSPAGQPAAASQQQAETVSTAGAGSLALKTVFLSDIADIQFEKPEGNSYTKANMKPTVFMTVYKNEDANAVQIERSVREKMEQLEKEYPFIKFEKIDDSARYITTSVEGMTREGILGALFAVIIIALFLRNWRATVIAVLSIPLSILIAIILMPRFGISLNMMSLSGMAVATGRIVDDSIVVIENIFRRLQKRKSGDEEIVEDATREVSSAITSSTVTTIAVFLPLAFIEGMIGKIFASFAVTVVICILASLLVAVTVVPVMGRLMLMKKPPKHKEQSGMLENGYKKVLGFALSHRLLVVLFAIVLMGSSFFLATNVGVKFLPADKNNIVTASVKLPAGTSADETNREVIKFEEYLTSNTDVKLVTSRVGDTSSSSEAAFGEIQGSNEAHLNIVLKEDADAAKALEEIKSKAKELQSSTAAWVIKPLDHYSGGERLEVVVNGDNVDDIKAAAASIEASIKGVPSVSNIANNLSEKKPEISIKVDSEKAAQKGLNPALTALQVRSMLNYDKLSSIENDGKSVDLFIGVNKKDLSSVEKIQNLELKSVTGAIVAVKDIAEVSIQDGPVSISERDGKRYASITADITSDDTAKVVEEVTAKIDTVKNEFKPGVSYNIGGSMDDINETFTQMGLAMLIAILLVFITMVLTFKEATAPFAILFSLPFAAVGALLALVITNHPLSMSGLVGILMLIGIVVTNAIVLVDRVQSNRRKGMEVKEALLEAGAVRLRPIIMTAAATVMALIPLAAGFSEGAIISEELGIVVIGGLTMSTVLTLVIVPVVFSLLEGLKMRVTRKTPESEKSELQPSTKLQFE